jgi:hypothetical protein
VLLEKIIEKTEAAPSKLARQGRPKTVPVPGWTGKNTLMLSSGVSLTRCHDSHGHFIRIDGKGIDANLLEAAIQHLQFALEKPS